jgi:asparagine synthase (glutamine-hydrolysing)
MLDFFGSYSTLQPASLSHYPSHKSNPLYPCPVWYSSDRRVCFSMEPVLCASGNFALVLKGQIYNHSELRRGLRFQSWRTDTAIETLVEGLSQRGPAFLLDTRGMFAFAAYDYTREQLLLGRDRIGLESLFTCWQPDGLSFSSSLTAFSCSLSPSFTDHSFPYNYALTNVSQTFLGPEDKGLQIFPAGFVVRLNHNRPHDPVRYWPPQPRPNWTALPIRTQSSASSFLRRQLEEIIRYHLASIPDPVCLLSPDVGSFCLASLVCCTNSGPSHSLTVSLPGDDLSISTRAQELSLHCGLIHENIHISEDQALSWLESSLSVLDCASLLNPRNLIVARSLSENSKLAILSSSGSEELFGRHSHHHSSFLIQCLSLLPPILSCKLLDLLSKQSFASEPVLAHTECFSSLISLSQRLDCLALGDLPQSTSASLEASATRITQARGQRSWVRLFGSLEPLVLRQLSALGTYYNIRHSFPFLDHRIVELALRIPQRFHCSRHGLLYSACHDLLPSHLIDTFNHPHPFSMSKWILGPLRSTCLSRIQYLYHSDQVDHDWLRSQWQAFEASKLSWSSIWTLVVLGESLRRSGL